MNSASVQIERQLPQNLEAERSVLGAILLDNHALNTAIEKLKPEDFFSDQHRRIFNYMIQLGEAQQPIDLVTLSDQLRRKGELEAAGGAAYLSQLVDGVPRVSNLEHYARIIRKAARARRLIYAADSLKEVIFAGEDPTPSVQHISSLAEATEVASALFDTPEEFESAPEATFSIEGFLQDYAVTAIAGLSENGKTWISLNLAAALLFGPGRLWDFFEVAGRAEKVIYLIPEASRATFKTRLKLMGLYDEIGKRLFVRTLTKGPTLPLADPAILREAKGAHVFCDTAIRFMRADENAAVEAAQGLSDDFFTLQRAEARSVIALFHSPKSFASQDVMSLENMIRGSSEFGAAIASAWGIRQIDRDLNIVHVSNIKARDFARCGDFQLAGRPHIAERGEFAMHRRPGDCGLLSEYLEARNRGGGASEAVKEAKSANVELLRQWLTKEPRLSSVELSAKFAQLNIKLGDSAIRKYRKGLGL